jgi:hypothetical protein
LVPALNLLGFSSFQGKLSHSKKVQQGTFVFKVKNNPLRKNNLHLVLLSFSWNALINSSALEKSKVGKLFKLLMLLNVWILNFFSLANAVAIKSMQM